MIKIDGGPGLTKNPEFLSWAKEQGWVIICGVPNAAHIWRQQHELRKCSAALQLREVQLSEMLQRAKAAEARLLSAGQDASVERLHKQALLQRLRNLQKDEALLNEERKRVEAETVSQESRQVATSSPMACTNTQTCEGATEGDNIELTLTPKMRAREMVKRNIEQARQMESAKPQHSHSWDGNMDLHEEA